MPWAAATRSSRSRSSGDIRTCNHLLRALRARLASFVEFIDGSASFQGCPTQLRASITDLSPIRQYVNTLVSHALVLFGCGRAAWFAARLRMRRPRRACPGRGGLVYNGVYLHGYRLAGAGSTLQTTG